MIVLGAGILYWKILLPIQQAQSGAPEVETSDGMIRAGVFFVMLGLAYLIFGTRFSHVFQPSSTQSRLPAYVAGGVVVVIAIFASRALKAYLQGRGYLFH